eukprot:scaffold310286_cov30-Attheya_sp.AAC.1
MKECGSILNKGGREAFSGVTLGNILEAEEEPLGVDCREDAVSIRKGQGGLKVEGGSTIIRSEAAAWSWSLFLDFLLDLALRVVEGEWVMGTELSLWMCFDLDNQSAEGGGLGNG